MIAAAGQNPASAWKRDDSSHTHSNVLLLLVQVMLAPIEGMQQAHGLLTPEERERWGSGLGSAGILPGDDEREMRHYVGGYLNSSEDLAGEKMDVAQGRQSG